MFSIKHEVCHLRAQHVKKHIFATALTPLAVQAACSTVSYGAKKLFRMNSTPKTIPGLIGRSSLAFGGIVPKTLMGIVGLSLYTRHQESQADRYACKHATKQELIAARDLFQGWGNGWINKFCNKKDLDEHVDEKFGKDCGYLQNFFVCYLNIIAPRILSLGRELFEDGYNPIQAEKDHPFKYRWFKFLLKSSHFVFDKDHPWPGDRADAIGRALQEFDKKNKMTP